MTVVESNLNTSTLPAVKSEPVIVTDEPAIPVVGLRVIAGLPITVNVATATTTLGVREETIEAQRE